VGVGGWAGASLSHKLALVASCECPLFAALVVSTVARGSSASYRWVPSADNQARRGACWPRLTCCRISVFAVQFRIATDRRRRVPVYARQALGSCKRPAVCKGPRSMDEPGV